VLNLEADKAYWLPKDPPGEFHGDLNEGPEPISMLVRAAVVMAVGAGSEESYDLGWCACARIGEDGGARK
jgi:hypothetical protein